MRKKDKIYRVPYVCTDINDYTIETSEQGGLVVVGALIMQPWTQLLHFFHALPVARASATGTGTGSGTAAAVPVVF